MIDVFPNLIGEDIFKYFDYNDYLNLSNVLDDICAKILRDYMANSEADPEIVDYLKSYCNDKIQALTLHLDLRERGITDMVANLSPDTILHSTVPLEKIIDDLTYIMDNEGSITVTLPRRGNEEFQNWYKSLTKAQTLAKANGEHLMHPDMLQKISKNKYIFYTPNNVTIPTGAKIFRTRKRQWFTCLRGAQYIQKCNELGLSTLDRRLF